MEEHWVYTDIEFEQLFNKCELPPAEFSHEAHLRLAWFYISRYGIEQAEENIQSNCNNLSPLLVQKISIIKP